MNKPIYDDGYSVTLRAGRDHELRVLSGESFLKPPAEL